MDEECLDEGALCDWCGFEVGTYTSWDSRLIGWGCLRSANNEANLVAEETRRMDRRIGYRLQHYFHHHLVATCPICLTVVA